MKLIVLTIFCLVITETITGSSISGEHHEPEAVNNSQKNPVDTKIDSIEPSHAPDSNKTTTTTTTTTTPVTPPNTTTTTVSPPTTTSTTVTPPTSSSTTTAPNTTITPAPHTTVKPTDTPAHKADRKFDSFSFIAGIVMAAGLMAIGLVAFKFYEARRDRNYHTI